MRNRKWTRRLLLFVGVSLLSYFGFFGKHNLYTLWKLKKRKSHLQEQITEKEQERARLFSEIGKLKTDSTYIEKIAREQFKMGKKGEKIYLLNSKQKK